MVSLRFTRLSEKSKNISFLAVVNPKKTPSTDNTAFIKSSSTEDIFMKTGELKEVTQHYGRRIIEDIVEQIFDEQVGLEKAGVPDSSTGCSSTSSIRESIKMDKRLKLWEDTLTDRLDVQLKIWRKTGKRPGEMLFNLPTTVEQRDKGTVNRLMDVATRLNPVALKGKQVAVLPGHFNSEQCKFMNELRETLPTAEQKGEAEVEISGLTTTTKDEIMGPVAEYEEKHSKQRTKWMNSRALEQRIEREHRDIKRVLEFFPDAEHLEVVGQNILKDPNVFQVQAEELNSFRTISSTTMEFEEEGSERSQTESSHKIELEKPSIAAGIKINNEIFIMNDKRSAQNIDVPINFQCEPYHRQLKQVLRFENIGHQVIICKWRRTAYHKRNSQFLATGNDTFLFDKANFVLRAGDVHVTNVVFQPRRVCLVKERWELRIFPQIFCGHRDSLVVRLIGKCTPPEEYVRKTNHLQSSVIDKSNKTAMDKLGALHAELTPLIQPHEVLCPYERVFDEREIFNAENLGYHCDRFDDLEHLKNLYRILKKPREPQWDFRLDSLKRLIMRQPEPIQREIHFQLLMESLEPFKCSTDGLPSKKFEHNAERDRSRYIYVRGAIANGIEEWEDLIISLEESSLKLELRRFYDKLEESKEKQNGEELSSDEDEEPKPWMRQLKQQQPELYVLKKMRSKKYFRDSLYIHTYTQLCDMAENLVSVIESTEYV
ncbi:uncharacterized protein LOC115633768 [Scaptodrosophila lebanonensis]|uniref:Uncharacterized protein LOC115633768 n=1 Tax=Drosophila lebanonensis TaxID=7225 RepID=A0A6J2UHZ3_DROLE|nr:uncharacterized protein LOC115633768 [Scaptodrosophila lebanonensis]